MQLSGAIEGFLLARTSQLSPRTLREYGHYLNLWLEYAGDVDLAKISRTEVRKFFAWLVTDYRSSQDRPLGQSGQRNAYIALRSFWTWASSDLGIKDQAAGISPPKLPESAVIPFTRADVEALLETAQYARVRHPENRRAYRAKRPQASRDRAMLLVLLDTGIRVGELVRLNIDDVDIRNRILEVRAVGSGTKSRPRTIPITARTASALWRYLTERQEADEVFTKESPLFASTGVGYSHNPGGRMSREAVYNLLKRLAERAEVRNVHPHRFRHTFAIEYLRGGGNQFQLKYLLGHGSMAMVERYLHFTGDDYREVHQRVSAVERWKL